MISVVICTYNRAKYISLCLNALFNSISSSNYSDSFEVILIDNNSTDNTENVIAQMIIPSDISFVYYKETRQGLSFARNRGIELSRFDYVSFIDDDAIVHSDWSIRLYDYLINFKPIAFGGKILPRFESTPPSWFSSEFETCYSILDVSWNSGPFPMNSGPVGANMGFAKSRIDDPYFSTSLGRVGTSLLSGEESEFFSRIKDVSSVHFISDVCVDHIIPSERLDIGWLNKRFFYGGLSHVLSKKSYVKKIIVVFIFLFRLAKSACKGSVIFNAYLHMFYGALYAIFNGRGPE